VSYLQFKSGASVEWTPAGKVKTRPAPSRPSEMAADDDDAERWRRLAAEALAAANEMTDPEANRIYNSGRPPPKK